MPCSDSSSSINIKLDKRERFISFDYAKITCGREINGATGLNKYLKGKRLPDIVNQSFYSLKKDLKVRDEESQFILYMEWDALRSAIVQYLGIAHQDIDSQRCQITSVEYTGEGIEVAEVILPPQEMPKILPCSLGDQ